MVIGGTSAEYNLKTVKLASTKYLDNLNTEGAAFITYFILLYGILFFFFKGNDHGRGFRDLDMEQRVLKLTRSTGKYYFVVPNTIVLVLLQVLVLNLEASISAMTSELCACHVMALHVQSALACLAQRTDRHFAVVNDLRQLNVKVVGKINADGVFLEQLETDPSKYMPEVTSDALEGEVIKVETYRKRLKKFKLPCCRSI